jgi:hypothetical protein
MNAGVTMSGTPAVPLQGARFAFSAGGLILPQPDQDITGNP